VKGVLRHDMGPRVDTAIRPLVGLSG